MSDLYVIGQQGGDHLKIGRTAKGVDNRLRRLQTASPHTLYLAMIGYGMGWMEGALHGAFANERCDAQTEWFTCGGVAEAFVDYLWATCKGVPDTPAEVFESVAVALRSRAPDASRKWWARERYEAVADTYRHYGARMVAYADEITHEAAERFKPDDLDDDPLALLRAHRDDPDADLPTFAEAITRKRLESPEIA